MTTTTPFSPTRLVLAGFCVAVCATLACGSPANFVPKDGGHGGTAGTQGSGGASSPQQDASMDVQGDVPIASGGAGGLGGNFDGGGTGGGPGSGSGGVPAASGGAAGGPNGTGGGVPASSGGAAGGPNGTGGRGGSSVAGGKSGSGGAAGAPNGTGGVGATGGTTVSCQPKTRDCSSHLDNNCNGTPDDQEAASCVCKPGTTQACGSHPQDGIGICKAGHQTCSIGSDKTTSSWSGCTDSVGPGTEVCDAQMVDENCNGQSNEGCECVGTTATCDCGGTTTCNNGKKGTCAVTKATMYRDVDGDTYGDPNQSTMVCPGTSGYVSAGSDCDDQNGNIGPGYTICTSPTSRKYCASGGLYTNETCTDGCQNFGTYGDCRTGTIGIAGSVSCWNVGVVRAATCSTSVGCTSGSCGTAASPGKYRCDGPNDCPGQTCCSGSDPGGSFTRCVDAASCTGQSIVCDPLGISPCESGYHCPANGIQLVTCQPN